MKHALRQLYRWSIWAAAGVLLLAFLSLVIIGCHDYRVYRSEFDPTLAYLKSAWFVESRIGTLPNVNMPPLGQANTPHNVVEIRDGLYHIVSWVERQGEAGAWQQTMYECTLECTGLDGWRVIDLKIGDGPVVTLNEELSPTGKHNRLWLHRLFGL